jgi:crotonobetainyl-CoA:carnitine CoA-transferase CaiB-like acyl-CoA transferase
MAALLAGLKVVELARTLAGLWIGRRSPIWGAG